MRGHDDDECDGDRDGEYDDDFFFDGHDDDECDGDRDGEYDDAFFLTAMMTMSVTGTAAVSMTMPFFLTAVMTMSLTGTATVSMTMFLFTGMMTMRLAMGVKRLCQYSHVSLLTANSRVSATLSVMLLCNLCISQDM